MQHVTSLRRIVVSTDGQLIAAGDDKEGDAKYGHDGGPDTTERGELANLAIVPEIEQGHRNDLQIRTGQKQHQGYGAHRQQEHEKPARDQRRDQQRQDDADEGSRLPGAGDGGGLFELGMNLNDAELRIAQVRKAYRPRPIR